MLKNLFPDLSLRSTNKEQMDFPDCDPQQLIRTLEQFRWMNLLVSRYRTLLRKFILSDMLKKPEHCFRLLDIGCGGCDIPLWMQAVCKKAGLTINITCVDSDPRVVAYAKALSKNRRNVEVIRENVFNLENLNGPFDYIFANHFFHHLNEKELVPAVKKIEKHAQRIFIISDIQRSPISYLAFFIFVPLIFHRSFIYKDGLQSIKRGFILEEFKVLRDALQISTKIHIGQMFPGRIYIIGNKEL